MTRWIIAGLLTCLGAACAPPLPRSDAYLKAVPATRHPVQRGQASWYGDFHHGRRTASGERFDMFELTAAHRTLPLGTRVRVTNLSNGRSVDVRVTDRGPYVANRIIDVSYGAADALDAVDDGVFPVTIVRLDP